jgi:hypothetical protein
MQHGKFSVHVSRVRADSTNIHTINACSLTRLDDVALCKFLYVEIE